MMADALDRDALAVASRDQQHEIRKRRSSGHQTWKPRREGVRLQVIDGDVGQPLSAGDPLGHHAADDQAADQAGTGGRRDSPEVREPYLRLPHRLPDLMGKHVEMRPCRDLGYHAAIGRVLTLLGSHDLGQDPAVGVEHGDGGLITGRLDAENRAHWKLSPFAGRAAVIGRLP